MLYDITTELLSLLIYMILKYYFRSSKIVPILLLQTQKRGNTLQQYISTSTLCESYKKTDQNMLPYSDAFQPSEEKRKRLLL